MSWLIASFLRYHHTNFQSGCTNLNSHQQWRSVPLTPHPLQHKLSSVFFVLAILSGVRWYLSVILIFISLMTKDVEQFLKCLSTIWDPLVENSLFSSISYFLNWIVWYLMSSFLSSLYILEIRCGIVEDHLVFCRCHKQYFLMVLLYSFSGQSGLELLCKPYRSSTWKSFQLTPIFSEVA